VITDKGSGISDDGCLVTTMDSMSSGEMRLMTVRTGWSWMLNQKEEEGTEEDSDPSH
jgi:hypothetical protein